jgi:predicted nucleic acid-binding protein
VEVFVDTSAIFAVLEASDTAHAKARRAWTGLLDAGVSLITTNYIVVEACALLQSRIGLDALCAFVEEILPIFTVHWITPEQHASALQVVLSANRRKLSLVDSTSFIAMRERGIRRAFAFDEHFREQGFTLH